MAGHCRGRRKSKLAALYQTRPDARDCRRRQFCRHCGRDAPRCARRSGGCLRCAGLPPAAAATYFHQLLLGLGGWSQLARQKLWEAELADGPTPITTDMLNIRLVWDKALLLQYAPQICAELATAWAAHAAHIVARDAQIVPCILQDAA